METSERSKYIQQPILTDQIIHYRENMTLKSRMLLPKFLSEGIKATGIKFEVLSGLGDFVADDEMEFYKTNTVKHWINNFLPYSPI